MPRETQNACGRFGRQRQYSREGRVETDTGGGRGGLRETEPYLSWRSPPGFSSSLPATQPGKGPRPWRPRGPPKATRSPAPGAPPARLSFPKPPCSPSRSSCHTIPHRHILTPEPRMSCCCCCCVCVCVCREHAARGQVESLRPKVMVRFRCFNHLSHLGRLHCPPRGQPTLSR